MSRRITPGGRRFDRRGIPIVAVGVLLLAGLVPAACRTDEPRQPGATYVTPSPTPPGRPELGPGGGVR